MVYAEPSRADALVVMSGSANYIERTRWAAQLFREGRAPMVLVTNDDLRGGWSSSEQRNPYFFEREVDELHAAGVPSDKIVVIREPVSSTYEEATMLQRHAVSNSLRSLVVVTSAYHSRRALWSMRRAFEGSGIEIGIDPVAPDQTSKPANWWLRKRGWREVPSEYVKLVYYWVKYRS
jgi:uncharacterized SAM-binding protein YcdF (DUF218 family)